MAAAHDRVSEFLEGVRYQRRSILTPEGVTLAVDVAPYSERVTAFLLDLVIWTIATVAFYLILALLIFGGISAFGATGGVIAFSILYFISFFVRNLYFLYFELTWQGSTPGKRIVGIRVIDRRGGPLLPGAVIARNLTRDIEMFLPIGFLMGGAAGGWSNLALGVWLLLFAALPLFNRDRLRGGDLIAGTMVIALPKRVLLGDLVDTAASFSFTEAQLKAYGTFELQILEALLRRPPSDDTTRLRRDVCDKICRKIDWDAKVPPRDVDAFLRDFYVAERAHLEREQLYGRGRADKGTAG